jgi:cysteine protease ATG4
MGLESMSEPDTDHPSTMEDEFYDASQMSSPKVAQTESISGKTESIVDVEDESQMLTPAAKYPPDYKTPNLPVDDREEEDEWDNPSSSSSATRNSTSSVEPPRSNGREFPPIIRAPSPRTPPLPPSGQIAFPLAGEDDDEQSWQDAYPSRMMPIRARDGGRTESGGVKGVLYKAGEDDWRES